MVVMPGHALTAQLEGIQIMELYSIEILYIEIDPLMCSFYVLNVAQGLAYCTVLEHFDHRVVLVSHFVFLVMMYVLRVSSTYNN